MLMDVTLIDPDDPSATPHEFEVRGSTRDKDATHLTYKAWMGMYVPAGRDLKQYAGPNSDIDDLSGHEAVLADDDGDVIAAGLLKEVEIRRNKYYLHIAVTPSPRPTF